MWPCFTSQPHGQVVVRHIGFMLAPDGGIHAQAANDAGNLDDIREFTSPEMFAELKMDITERGPVTSVTEVVSIDADVLDVAEETTQHVVSVRFNGLIREDKFAPAEAFDEVWHLTKSRDGRTGWVLSGIQQMQ